MKYDYLQALIYDIKKWMRDNDFDLNDYDDIDDACEYLLDTLWVEDYVTGNGTIGYASRELCEDYLSHNWDELIEAIKAFYITMDEIINTLEKRNVEYILQWFDSLIRLNLLPEAISRVLNDIDDEKGF